MLDPTATPTIGYVCATPRYNTLGHIYIEGSPCATRQGSLTFDGPSLRPVSQRWMTRRSNPTSQRHLSWRILPFVVKRRTISGHGSRRHISDSRIPQAARRTNVWKPCQGAPVYTWRSNAAATSAKAECRSMGGHRAGTIDKHIIRCPPAPKHSIAVHGRRGQLIRTWRRFWALLPVHLPRPS